MVHLNREELNALEDATNTAFRLYVLLRSSGRWTYPQLRVRFVRDLARSKYSHRPTRFELQRALHALWRLGLVRLTKTGRDAIHVEFPLGEGSCALTRLGGAWVDKGPDVPIARPPVKKQIRDQVFARDGRVCAGCGATSSLTIDHIRPVAHGGTDALENLRVLCRRCNSRKHAKVWE